MTKGQKFELENFECVHNPYSDPGVSHPRGAVSCFISEKFKPYILNIDSSSDDLIRVLLRNDHVVFSCYVPPQESLYFNELCFSGVCNMFTPVDRNVCVIGGGDLNTRFGQLSRKMGPDKMYSVNPDKEVNSHGKTLINICKSYKCYILNNLDFGDKIFDGNFTYRKKDKKSQVDVCLANTAALKHIDNFTIHDSG